jgi:hypothetical protein
MQEELSTFRLNLMRVLYLMMFLFLASTKWPLMIHHREWAQMEGVAFVFLAALGVLAGWGLRYPVKMLPVLLFEFLWKALWLVAVALPLWRAGHIDPDTAETVRATLPAMVICPIVIPWGYVWRNYIVARGDRWLPSKAAAAAAGRGG